MVAFSQFLAIFLQKSNILPQKIPIKEQNQLGTIAKSLCTGQNYLCTKSHAFFKIWTIRPNFCDFPLDYIHNIIRFAFAAAEKKKSDYG